MQLSNEVPDNRGDCRVVILTSPDKGSLPYPLEKDWRCHAKAGRYFVFILPETEQLLPEADVIASISKTTAFYMLNQWLHQRFLFLSRSANCFPTLGYVIRANRLAFFNTKTFFHTPANAIRIRATDVEDPRAEGLLKIDAGVLDLNCVRELSCRLPRSLAWCHELWQKVPELVADETRFIQQLVRMTELDQPFDASLPLDRQCSEVDVKHLAVAHLFSYWEHTNTKLEERGRQLERLGVVEAKLGEDGIPKAAAGTVANLMMSAGLTEPNRSAASRFFKHMESSARYFYEANQAELENAKTQEIVHFEYWALAFLTPILPHLFDRSMHPSSIGSRMTDEGQPIVMT